jgi:hypothetical protein
MAAMKAAHFICRRDGIGLRRVTRVEGRPGVWRSGDWDMKPDDARSLIGGWIFLHETKAQASVFGGVVLDLREVVNTDLARSERVVFELEAKAEGKGARWRGASHAMAACGGIVDL